jgi:hypothetical protein
MSDTKQADETEAENDFDFDAFLRRYGLDRDDARRAHEAAVAAVDAQYEKAIRVHEFRQKVTKGGRGKTDSTEDF